MSGMRDMDMHNPRLREICDHAVSSRKVALGWVNSYSGVIVKSHRTSLVFDPVRMNLDEHCQMDAIVITHEHSDHFDPKVVKELQKKKPNPIVLTTPFVAQKLSEGRVIALEMGDSFAFQDIGLYAERCDHPANQPLSFIISIENGIVIYHSSDSEPFPEMEELGRKYRPDILLYMATSLKNAVQIARLVKPEVVLFPYTDKILQSSFTYKLESEVPETKARALKQFEIYQYP